MSKNFHNYVGESFGDITVIDELEPHITPNGSKQRIVRCKCSCGNVYATRLTSAKINKKCTKCLALERRKDITGKRFGKLLVISMAQDYISPNGVRLARCKCKCDCGKECVVNMSGLVTGKTRSCGCLQKTAGLLVDNPDLVKKYDYEKNKDIDIYSLTARTPKKIWWKCDSCGNSWQATIASQNDKIKHGCPYCSGRLVTEGKNDLKSQFPDLLTEWDYDKNRIKPNEISYSSGRKVWWKCSECGHSWIQTVSNRTGNKSGCPKCNIERVNSFSEQAVFYYIKKAFPDAVNGDMHIGMELDIFIPSINTAVEYDGDAWHKGEKQEVDLRKNQLCKKKSIKLFRIREPLLDSIGNCIEIRRTDSTTSSSLDHAILELLSQLGVNDIVVNTDRDTPGILEQYSVKKHNNSLLYLFPEIASEWHPTKNCSLTPDRVNKASSRMVWWLGKCGHEWQMRISDRTHKEYTDLTGRRHKSQGCPYCNKKRILVGFNDLKSLYPKVAKEWHPTKNKSLKPIDVMPGSNKEVWWQGKCGHEWKMTPNERCGNKRGCPICYKMERSPAVICKETQKVYKSVIEAANAIGLKDTSPIYRCCRGEQKTSKGYHWEFKKD